MNLPKIAYISFDTVPAPKGAAIHIQAFVSALGVNFGDVQLVTVSPTTELQESTPIHPQVKQTTLPALGDNLIQRVIYFRRLLRLWLEGKRFDVIHIRSIYEGFVIAVNKNQYCDKLIFEVNGLPSIELKYRYPRVSEDRELLHKLSSQEQICLSAADLIITPSKITATYLQQQKNIPAAKIQVIPNGVDLHIFTYRHPENKIDIPWEMLYFGTLSAWQGVNLAVEALGLINRDITANLTIIGQARELQTQALKQLALKFGVADRLTILEPMSQPDLVTKIHAANVILSPLTPSDRNLVQGCCPLKILEGMATGVPVIASDLPVVRELGEDGVDFLLVKPGSAKAIKDAVFRLYHEPELAIELASHARQRIITNYTWQQAGETLVSAYQELGIKRSITV
ncbi:glycosyltransferase family 4 protein [Aliinostoc sp. HNIBRCY26]|uniref:glycosyltransferase family 4 protein n=1 Tax=Aliinostoc sp. HNIBRCY26 TaxID=3418997 RepID=UPI003D094756